MDGGMARESTGPQDDVDRIWQMKDVAERRGLYLSVLI